MVQSITTGLGVIVGKIGKYGEYLVDVDETVDVGVGVGVGGGVVVGVEEAVLEVVEVGPGKITED